MTPPDRRRPAGGRLATRAAGDARPPFAWSWRTGLVVFVLVAANIVVFTQVSRCDFVHLDDDVYVSDNPHVRAGLSWDGLLWALTTFHGANWHPLTWISHMLDVDLFGLSPGAHHVTNLALHILNSVLVFLVLGRLSRALWPSAFVAALFAVHPAHVESVAWIAERKDVLSTLFWLLALGAYGRYVAGVRPRRWFAATFVLLALGLLAKPMLVTLPFVLLLLDIWPLRRLRLTREPDAPRPLARAWPLVREKLPLIALSAASCAVTLAAQHSGGAIQKLEVIPLAQRFLNTLVSYGKYVAVFVWPANLAVYYPLPAEHPAWQVLLGFVPLAAVTALVARGARRAPYLPVGWLWFLGVLVPVIGLVQVGAQAMADRYTYVPFVGLSVIVAWGAGDLAARWRVPPPAVACLAALTIAGLGVLSWRQVGFWRDDETLFRRALAVTRDNVVIENNLCLMLSDHGRVDEAAACFAGVLRRKPDDVKAHLSLGSLLARQGQGGEALPHFLEVVRLDPDNSGARTNLGLLLLRERKLDEAMAQLERAVRLDPRSPEAQNNLGLALLVGGRAVEAAERFRAALALKPDFPEAQGNLRRATRGITAAGTSP